MKLAASLIVHPQAADLAQTLGELPEASGVYALRNGDAVSHLSWTANLRRRLTRLLRPDREAGARLLAQMTSHGSELECWPTGSALETALHLYVLARRNFPSDYLRRMRLRLPWFVSVTSDDFPRLSAGSRMLPPGTTAIGPFHNRESAVRYEEAALQLFQIRRCTETLEPFPDHPGCIYGEMNLCLRPCQQMVSKDEYATEAERLRIFLVNGPDASITSLGMAREKAAADLDFEGAAQIHRTVERARAAKEALPEIAGEPRNFHGVALEPGLSAESCTLRVMYAAQWRDPVSFMPVDPENHGVSLDRRLREALEPAASSEPWPGELTEHLAIFSRWFHSHSRHGEWFPFTSREGLPYRKLSRGLSKWAAQREPAATARH